MSDPFANTQLELACKVGAIDDIVEALEDGADIDCNGGAPLFSAIMAGDRAVVETLVSHGADVTLYLGEGSGDSDLAARVDALIAMSGSSAGDENSDGAGAGTPEVDSKMVGALDRMIRRNGLREPFLKKRADQLPAFRDALNGIGAEDCHAVVSEFLEALEAARRPAGDTGEAEVDENAEADEDRVPAEANDEIFLASEAERIAEWSTRYVSADEAPAALAKEYLKERKKLEADA